MNYLLDTCAVFELIKLEPQPEVVREIQAIDNEALFLSVLTLGELEKGIARLPHSKKKRELTLWLNQELIPAFEDRILYLNRAGARCWGQLQGQAFHRGQPLPVVDSMIAAVALVENLTVITRNTRDLERCGVRVFDPWPKNDL